ncbi:hypothetical protein ANO11243_013750 [Dothideomycetidae sp. 11243]|nr:hypothetical protein ANO11243_013750 [fungal sp. No.11243]
MVESFGGGLWVCVSLWSLPLPCATGARVNNHGQVWKSRRIAERQRRAAGEVREKDDEQDRSGTALPRGREEETPVTQPSRHFKPSSQPESRAARGPICPPFASNCLVHSPRVHRCNTTLRRRGTAHQSWAGWLTGRLAGCRAWALRLFSDGLLTLLVSCNVGHRPGRPPPLSLACGPAPVALSHAPF